MTIAFDTLRYVRRLQDAGVERSVAEAHADLARDMILADLVTKGDLDSTKKDIDHELRQLEHRLTIKLGGMVTVAVAVLIAAERLLWAGTVNGTA